MASEGLTTKDKVLETGTSLTQNFEPIKGICAYLNAFHVYTSDTSRSVEAHHYCSHLSPDVRQCLIYDQPTSPARLIGVEYMITRKLYEKLDAEERKLWHSHVKSGMLIIPNANVPAVIWDKAEIAELEEVIGLYGKTYHFWQTDRGDELPLGKPELMGSFISDEQAPWERIKERDERFGVSTEEKKKQRSEIVTEEIHEDADQWWKK
ncbi:hypothetical protein B7494_g886 [Chlorociboria aeruginascens]|nr:hypothetical protein B7494_g886 [Chlorociboria aeruginascens]